MDILKKSIKLIIHHFQVGDGSFSGSTESFLFTFHPTFTTYNSSGQAGIYHSQRNYLEQIIKSCFLHSLSLTERHRSIRRRFGVFLGKIIMRLDCLLFINQDDRIAIIVKIVVVDTAHSSSRSNNF